MASTVPHASSEELSIGGPNGCAVSDDWFKINCFRSMFAPDLPMARSRRTACTYVDVRGERLSLPALGALRLREVTTPLVDRFVTDLHEHVGPATGRTCRSIVSGVMALAVRHGAVPANPTRELERLSAQPRRVPRALSEEERARWFRALVGDQVALRQDFSICRRFCWRRVCESGRRWQRCGAMLILTWVFCG
jgi:hypothetical protein